MQFVTEDGTEAWSLRCQGGLDWHFPSYSGLRARGNQERAGRVGVQGAGSGKASLDFCYPTRGV